MTPATLLSKLLGPRKPADVAAIGAEIEARRVALAKAEATVTAAAQARAAALNECDTDGIAKAERDGAEARIGVEVGARALQVLAAAHAKAVEAERHRDQTTAAAKLIAEGEVIEREHREWDAAVKTLARLRHRAQLHSLAVDDSEFSGAVLPGAVPRLSLAATMTDFVTLDGTSALPLLPESARARATREAAEQIAADRQAHEEKMAAARARAIEEGRARVQAEREAEAEKDRRQSYYPDWRATLDVAR